MSSARRRSRARSRAGETTEDEEEERNERKRRYAALSRARPTRYARLRREQNGEGDQEEGTWEGFEIGVQLTLI